VELRHLRTDTTATTTIHRRQWASAKSLGTRPTSGLVNPIPRCPKSFKLRHLKGYNQHAGTRKYTTMEPSHRATNSKGRSFSDFVPIMFYSLYLFTFGSIYHMSETHQKRSVTRTHSIDFEGPRRPRNDRSLLE
jgi:hypothetical protein